MTDLGTTTAQRMPPSAWAFAWLCLAGQLPPLATRGLSDSDGVWVFLSMVLSALIIGWFAVGVLRGRTVRLVIAWIVLALAALFCAIGVLADLSDVSGWDVFLLVASVGQVVALAAYCSSDYFRWQRAHRELPGPDIGGLVAIAVVVGLVGGITAPSSGDNPPVQMRITLSTLPSES